MQIQTPKPEIKAKPSKISLEDRIKRMKERASSMQDPLLYSLCALRGCVCVQMPLGQVEDVGIKSLILIAMHASMHLGSQACFASLAWWYYCVRIEHVAYVGLSCSKCSGRAAAEKRRPPDKAASPFPSALAAAMPVRQKVVCREKCAACIRASLWACCCWIVGLSACLQKTCGE